MNPDVNLEVITKDNVKLYFPEYVFQSNVYYFPHKCKNCTALRIMLNYHLGRYKTHTEKLDLLVAISIFLENPYNASDALLSKLKTIATNVSLDLMV